MLSARHLHRLTVGVVEVNRGQRTAPYASGIER
jgi:hypothetical protein